MWPYWEMGNHVTSHTVAIYCVISCFLLWLKLPQKGLHLHAVSLCLYSLNSSLYWLADDINIDLLFQYTCLLLSLDQKTSRCRCGPTLRVPTSTRRGLPFEGILPLSSGAIADEGALFCFFINKKWVTGFVCKCCLV